jgi:hypothetical protein
MWTLARIIIDMITLFTLPRSPESGHEAGQSACPLWAKSGLMHCNIIRDMLSLGAPSALPQKADMGGSLRN